VNPGASERLVQITGAAPDNIEYGLIILLWTNRKGLMKLNNIEGELGS
jgi:hypothetical protein